MTLKISRELFINKPQPESSKGGHAPNFSRMMNAAVQTLQNETLQKALTAISEQGEKVAKHRSLQAVTKFKSMVKQFLQSAISQGYILDEQYSLHSRSSSIIVKQVDEKLIELTDALLDQEKANVDILELIGEIKGLLINIYT